MNDDDLRARLAGLAPSPEEVNPAAVDPVAIARTGRRRRLRRGAVTGAAVAVVAAAVAVPLATTGSSTPAHVSVVASGSAGTTPATTVGDCTLSQLRIRPGHVDEGGYGHGSVTLTMVVTNVGNHPCQLTTYPQVAGVTASGNRAALGRAGLYQAPLVLRPGAAAETLVIGYELPRNDQRPCPSYSSFVVQLSVQATTVVVSKVAPFIGTGFPSSCIPVTVSPFGTRGSFGGLDGVSQPAPSTSIPYCRQSNLRLGTPPDVPVVTPNGPGRVQVNLSVTNTGPECRTIPFINLNLYGPHDVLLAGQQTEEFDGSDPGGNNFNLPHAQTANFGLVLSTSGAATTCRPLSAVELSGSAGRVALDGKTGGPQACGMIMQAPVSPPAY